MTFVVETRHAGGLSLPFINCIKRIIYQIQQHPSNILRINVDFGKVGIKIGFEFGIKA
jgi:hypothetical protein